MYKSTLFCNRTILILLITLSGILNGTYLKAQQTINITKNWEFAKKGEPVFYPATVPGYVHTDLLNNNLIDSLYWGDNTKKYDFVGDTAWIYRTKIILDAKQMSFANKTLVFKGLDTYADIYLNGKLILSSDNMFLEYKTEIAGLLKKGSNSLEVHFKSPIKELKKEIAAYPLFYSDAHAKADKNNLRKFARKAQYQFGWDWACKLVPTGIYMPVHILLWNNAHITDVFVKQEILSAKKANLNAQVEIEATADARQEIVVEVNGKALLKKSVQLIAGINTIELPFAILNPKLWWPNGLGEHPLYKISVKLQSGTSVTDISTQRIGLRTVEFVNKFDKHGLSYYFKINNVPVFMKGANWVPMDMMLPSVTHAKYKDMLQQMVDANMNMIRIWGGGIYEYESFYNLCDEMGIMIYHDFMFASSIPPVDSSFLSRVEKEAIYQVKRLRNHPSMALWAGGNENESAYFEGFTPKAYPKEIFTVDFKKLFDQLLPSVVKKYNPELSYVRSSPTTGIDSIKVSKKGYGDTHAWAIWFGKIDLDKAKVSRMSRFISEYGFVGYPAMTSMKKYIPESEMDTASAVFQFRDAYKGIQAIMRDFIGRYYPQPTNLNEFIYISGLLQAESMEISNEVYRRNMPYCMGALLWQLNDVWPVASWSMVDYYGQWKPIMYRTRDNFAPVIVSVDQEKDSVKVYAVSDKLTDINANLELKLLDFNGKVLYSYSKPALIKANTSYVVYSNKLKDILVDNNTSNTMLIAQFTENGRTISRKIHYFARNKDLKLPPASVQLAILSQNNKTVIKVSTDKLAKNLYLIDSKGNLNFSDNYFDLPAGDSRTITMKENITATELKKRLSIFTLNDVMNK